LYWTLLYSLLVLIVAVSCLLQYCGARLLAPMTSSKQNRIAIVSLALCASALATFPKNIVVTNCFVLCVALFAGTLLSRHIGSVGALVTTLTVAAVVDLISTYAGPTRWINSQAQHAHNLALFQFLAVSFRLKRTLVPVIGVTDLMFCTVCVCVTRRGLARNSGVGRAPCWDTVGAQCGSFRRLDARASFPRCSRNLVRLCPTTHADEPLPQLKEENGAVLIVDGQG
jgi:hypothetical protein